jgi:hypothetical protein
MSSRFSRSVAHSAKCARTIGLFLACGLMAHAGTEKALAAQPAAAPAEAARQLKIPFAPPTGRELAYDVTITKSGARTGVTSSRQTLHFAAEQAGYILTVRTVRITRGDEVIDLTSPTGVAALPAELRPFLLPFEIDVDREGNLVRLRNWGGLKAALDALPEAMAQAENDQAKRDQIRAIGQRVMAPYRDLTAEQAPQAMLKGWPAVFGFGGVELEDGAEYSGETEEPSPLLPVSVPMTQRFSLTDAAEQGLYFQQSSEPDQEKTAKIITEFVRSAGQDLPASQRAKLDAALGAMKGMTLKNEIDILFDRHTGLAQRAILERRMTIPGQGDGGEKIELTSVP